MKFRKNNNIKVMKNYKEFIKYSNFETNENNNDDVWVFEGDFKVTKDMVDNGMMIKEKIPVIVNGKFDCSSLELTTLKNCPEMINGSFDCEKNELTSLKFGPKEVFGNYNCDNNKLSNLEFCPEKVEGFFSCSGNKLTSLKGSPEEIMYDFYCNYNQLTSLEFAPKKGVKTISFYNNVYSLSIEAKFIKLGYKDYWLDLLKYCIDNNIDLTEVKGWPEGFLTDDTIKSAKGINKFDL